MSSTKGKFQENLWLKVLAEYCSQDVYEAFNKMLDDQKLNFLKLLQRNALKYHERLLKNESGSDEEDTGCQVFEIGEELSYRSLKVALENCNDHSVPVVVELPELERISQWLGGPTQREKYLTCIGHSQWGASYNSFQPAFHCISINKDSLAHKNNDFSMLKPILIRHLQFGTSFGRFLEGVLITEPIPMSGITTFLEDETGDYLKLGLYNCIPGDTTRNEVANMKFPFGTRIQIAQPFFKCFADGTCGVRVDSPDDLQILDNFTDEENKFDLNKIREDGKRFFMKGNYLDALNLYLRALENFPETTNLCNNRAQCELNLGEFEEAILDTASVLLFDERNEKARHRYQKASEKLSAKLKGRLPNDEKRKSILLWEHLLQVLHTQDTRNIVQTVGSKKDGNKAFRAGHYQEAKQKYTAALGGSNTDVCLLLSNIAVVCLKLEMFQTAIAAANATFRITPAGDDLLRKKARFAMTKAFSMLGEIKMAEICGRVDETLKGFWHESKKPISVVSQITFNLFGMETDLKMGEALQGENIAIDYLAPDTVQHQYIDGKGRGIVATRDIDQMELILVDHMIYSKKQSDLCGGSYATDWNLSNKESQNRLFDKFMALTKHDGLLVKKLLLLENRKKKITSNDRKLPLISDLNWMGYRSLCHQTAPLLPQTPYEVKVDNSWITSDFIKSIISTNVFGWGEKGEDGNGLTLRLSLFNNDRVPNCTAMTAGDAFVVLARRKIVKGEELCISYGSQYDSFLFDGK